jgi:hypothetical protein
VNSNHVIRNVPRWIGLLLLCGFSCAGALPALGDTPSGLAACRQIADDARRLACYDALSAPPAAAAKPPVAPVAAAAAPVAAAPSIPAPAPASPASPPQPNVPVAAAPPPVPAANAPAESPPQSFGAETLAKTPEQEQSKSLSAKVMGSLDGVKQGTLFRLDNGQVWASIDDNEYFYEGENPGVVIQRNLLGSYWMKLEHAYFNVRVSRVK